MLTHEVPIVGELAKVRASVTLLDAAEALKKAVPDAVGHRAEVWNSPIMARRWTGKTGNGDFEDPANWEPLGSLQDGDVLLYPGTYTTVPKGVDLFFGLRADSDEVQPDVVR